MRRCLLLACIPLLACGAQRAAVAPVSTAIAQPGITAHLEDVLRWRLTVWLGALPAPQVAVRRPPPSPGRRTASSPGCGGWGDQIAAAFTDPARACRVMECESGGDPAAHNRSGASGLFQIMMPTHADLFAAHGWTADDVFDGAKNIVIASEMVAAGGWGAWVCR